MWNLDVHEWARPSECESERGDGVGFSTDRPCIAGTGTIEKKEVEMQAGGQQATAEQACCAGWTRGCSTEANGFLGGWRQYCLPARSRNNGEDEPEVVDEGFCTPVCGQARIASVSWRLQPTSKVQSSRQAGPTALDRDPQREIGDLGGAAITFSRAFSPLDHRTQHTTCTPSRPATTSTSSHRQQRDPKSPPQTPQPPPHPPHPPHPPPRHRRVPVSPCQMSKVGWRVPHVSPVTRQRSDKRCLALDASSVARCPPAARIQTSTSKKTG